MFSVDGGVETNKRATPDCFGCSRDGQTSSPKRIFRPFSSDNTTTTTKTDGMVTMDWKPNVELVVESGNGSSPSEDDTLSSVSCEQHAASEVQVGALSSVTAHDVGETAFRISNCFPNSGTPSTTVSPSTYLVMTLKNRKLKERIGTFSLLQAMYFEPYQEGDMEMDLLRALRSNNLELLQTVAAPYELEDARNQFGENPAHLMCRMGMPTPIIEYLFVEKKVPLNVRDQFGRSPLHNACMMAVPNFDNVEFLLDHAPKLFLFEDDSGKTPLEYIPRRAFDRWIRFLSERNILKRITSKLEKDESLVTLGQDATACC